MDAGAYRNKVVIQKYAGEFDGIGNPDGKWEDFKKAYAYVNGLSGREYWEAANVKQENTVEFIFRWKSFFDEMNTKQFRILFRNEVYNINSIDNIQFRNQTVKIKAVVKDGES